MQKIFEATPILLACYAALICAKQYFNDRRKDHKRVMLLGIICSLLLIIAQTSWYVTYVVQGNLLGTVFSDQLWTVFNSLTMLAFILLAHGGNKHVAKPSA
jgi:hypothetical protein